MNILAQETKQIETRARDEPKKERTGPCVRGDVYYREVPHLKM